MIKINIISNNKNWNKYLKNPTGFMSQKTKNLNKKFKKYKKKNTKNIFFFLFFKFFI